MIDVFNTYLVIVFRALALSCHTTRSAIMLVMKYTITINLSAIVITTPPLLVASCCLQDTFYVHDIFVHTLRVFLV